MIRINWRPVLPVAVGLSLAALMFWLLWPNRPLGPRTEPLQSMSPTYRPGGSTCDPTQLKGLSGDAAIQESNRCAESAETHRLQSNDLVQQTKAADAAAASAALSYQQTLIALCGVLVGFFTLMAAIAAAFYAKLAAEAAERSISRSLETSQQELRAHLAIEKEKVTRADTGKKAFSISFEVKNVGATPATNFNLQTVWQFRYTNGGMHPLADETYIPMTLASGATSEIDQQIILPIDESRAFRENKGRIMIAVKSDFNDDFGDHWIFRQLLSIDQECLKSGKIYTDQCEHVKSEKKRPEKPQSRRLLLGRT